MPGQEFVDTLLRELSDVETSIRDNETEIGTLFDTISRLEGQNKERYDLKVHLEALLRFYVPAGEPVSSEHLVENSPRVAAEQNEPASLADRLVTVLHEAGQPVSIDFAQSALLAAGVTLRGPRPRATVAAILAKSPRFVRNEQGLYSLTNRA